MRRQVILKEKRNVIEFDLKNVRAKKHKETKKACISFKSINFVKQHSAFFLVKQQNSDQEKKSFLKFSCFEGTPRP